MDLFGDPPKLEAVAGLLPLPILLLSEIPPGLVVLLLFPLFKLPALLRVIYYNKKNVLDIYLQGNLIIFSTFMFMSIEVNYHIS